MKRVLLIYFITVFTLSNAQTYIFSATTSFDHNGVEKGFPTVENDWVSYEYINIHVPVSGLSGNLTSGSLELLQVNLSYGDASQSFYTATSTDIYIQSPSATGFNKILDGYLSSSGLYKNVDIRLRDNASLNVAYAINSYSKPYDVGYYRTTTANEFDNFLGESPNGTWIIRFENSTNRTTPRITKIELVFGVLIEEDITTLSSNNDCSTPQEFCDNKAYIFYNNGFTHDLSEDPGVLFDGCQWNNGLDNIGWFAWTASETSAQIEISGIDAGETQQFIVLGSTNGSIVCDVNGLTSVTGGCPLRIDNTNHYYYSNGTSSNMVFYLSNLTIGNTYFLVVDGEGGNVSESYLTMGTGAGSCNTLPIKLKEFSGKNANTKNILKWVTSSEINNDFFTIERSTDGYYWEIIDVVEGAGNSNINLNYSYNDNEIESDKTYYYKLKQTDFDNKYTYSGVISITSENSTKNSFIIYPNPSDNGIFNINSNENLVVEIYNSNGSIIYNGTSKYVIDISKHGKGIYLLKAYGKNNTFTERIIIK